MQLDLSLFYLVCIYISYVHTQIIYECNFDTSTASDSCFTPSLIVVASAGIAGTSPPNGPQSDVTSILKPTTNGEVCMLPYKVGTFTWDMYFCYRNTCPTENSQSSECKAGKFGYTVLTVDKSFQIKTSTDGVNGIGEQCLTYYYYMPLNSQTPLRVDKQEKNGANQTIDSVIGSPTNGWVRRQATFRSNEFGYKIFFNLQKPPSGFPNIAFDEISIRQGSCNDQPVTSTTTAIPVQTTTTSIAVQTSTASIVTQTTETNPIPVETIITSIQIDTTTTTALIPVQTTETTPVSQSVTTTPVISTTTTSMEMTTISTTTTPIFETSYSDKVTTQEPIKSSTTSPIILTTTVTTTTTFPVEISTAQFSPSTTTPITISSATSTISTTSIPVETTSTTTFPLTVSSTTTSTIRTSSIPTTLSTTTKSAVENVIISSYDETLPRDKNHTIIMATVIPIIWIAFIGALIWVKKSTGVLGGLFHPFNNFSRDGEASAGYELSDVSEA